MNADRLIASTFEMFIAPSNYPVAAQQATLDEAVQTEADQPEVIEVAKRSVTSVRVDADGQPIWPLPRVSAASGATDGAPEAFVARASAADTTTVASTTAAARTEPQIEPLAFSQPATPEAAAEPEAASVVAATEAATSTLPAADAADVEKRVAHVGDSSINVRAGPGVSEKRLFVLRKGAEVEITDSKGNWVEIRTEAGRVGWVDAGNLATGTAAPADEATEVASIDPTADEVALSEPKRESKPEETADKRIVGGQGVNVRSGPATARGKLFALTSGSEVTVLGTEKGWLHIRDAKGRTGWAYKQYFR